MTKKFAATVILLLVTAFSLCACFPQPFKEISINSAASDGGSDGSFKEKPAETRSIYVSGAVQNDGFITVPQICDYKALLQIAGVVGFSVLPTNISVIIPVVADSLIVDFYFDGIAYSSINVNGGFVSMRLSADGVEDEIINKLADYIEVNGKITNRNMLKMALGDDYDGNYYKFYIDIDDYA